MKDFAYRWILSAVMECDGVGQSENVHALFYRTFIFLCVLFYIFSLFLSLRLYLFLSVPVDFRLGVLNDCAICGAHLALAKPNSALLFLSIHEFIVVRSHHHRSHRYFCLFAGICLYASVCVYVCESLCICTLRMSFPSVHVSYILGGKLFAIFTLCRRHCYNCVLFGGFFLFVCLSHTNLLTPPPPSNTHARIAFGIFPVAFSSLSMGWHGSHCFSAAADRFIFGSFVPKWKARTQYCCIG